MQNNQIVGEGIRLLSAVVRDRTNTVFKQIKREWMIDNEIELYDFIHSHYQIERVIPSTDTVREAGMVTTNVTESSNHYLSRVSNRACYNIAIPLEQQRQQALQARDMTRYKELTRELLQSIDTQSVQQSLISASDLGVEMISQLGKIKSHRVMIP